MERVSCLRSKPGAALVLLLGICGAILGRPWPPAMAGEAGVDLKGTVQDKDHAALTNASIFIYTAGPRVGAGILCPSCYADCRKTAKSGPHGEFRIESLASNLVFQVLVVAPGHVPTFFNKVDPLKGPLEAMLKQRPAILVPASQTILGQVLDSRREPVHNAVVSVNSTTVGETTSSRPPDGTDPLAITDEHGNFVIQSRGKFDAMSLRIEAQQLAVGNFAEVRPSPVRKEFILTAGASLTGRVLFGNRPLGDITIGVVGSDRSMGHFTGEFVIRTTETGRFLLVNLPPNRSYDLYGEMASVQAFGSLPVRSIRLGSDGSETDAGDLVVAPGFRVGGQVMLSDGAPLPDHTRLLLGRPAAWDTLTLELAADGHFEFTNVPPEAVTLDTRVNGYRFSRRNASLDSLNPFQLVGRLNGDTTNLVMLLEPGENLRPDYTMSPEGERPNDMPLGGAEAKRVIPGAVTFSGRVLDAATKAPLPEFRVTPGWQRNPSMQKWVEWYRGKSVQGTNGTFSLDFALKSGALVVEAQAEGYLPALSPPLTKGKTTSTIELQRGNGPSGQLLLPDGKPADGVTVCYLVGREQASLTSKGLISMFQNREASLTITDPDGQFDFAPKLGEGDVYAAGARGFAHCRASKLAGQRTLTLQPWGSVHGRLLQSSKPVAGEAVDAGWGIHGSMDRPWFNLHGTRTDDQGNFTIDYLPPGELELQTRVMLGTSSGWTTQLQRKFTLKPGEPLDLGEVEKAAASRVGR